MTKYTEESSTYESEYTEESISTYESDNDQSETEETEHDFALTTRYKNSDIRNIIIETIDDKYSKAKFGPFEVIMMSDNGYVNATKLCVSAKKDFFEWKRSKSAKSYMKYLESLPGFSGNKLIITDTGRNSIRGSYVHPDLIINIAQWCSPEYSHKVTKVMHEYHSKQAIEEKDAIIGKKDDKIDKLSKQIDLMREEQKREREEQKKQRREQKQEIQKLISLAKKQGVKLDRTTDELIHTRETLEETNERLDHVSDVLEDVATDRVVKGKARNCEILLVVENNCPKEDRPKKKTYYEYKVFRVAKKSKNSRLNTHKINYPNAEIIFEVDQPNSVNLWQRFLDKYNNKKIKARGCDFNLIRPCTKRSFLRLLNQMHDERFDID